jgi:hypothetical protein
VALLAHVKVMPLMTFPLRSMATAVNGSIPLTAIDGCAGVTVIVATTGGPEPHAERRMQKASRPQNIATILGRDIGELLPFVMLTLPWHAPSARRKGKKYNTVILLYRKSFEILTDSKRSVELGMQAASCQAAVGFASDHADVRIIPSTIPAGISMSEDRLLS